MAERLKNDCHSIANSRGNTIINEVPVDLRIYADPELLVEVLQNLLSNSLKYTSNGSISIGAAEEASSIVFWVTDTGVGIPPDRLNHIFQTGTPDPSVPESSGLGLAIVQKVVQLHGGHVSVESREGAGSAFRVEFPKSR